jgi:hypothetical protein
MEKVEQGKEIQVDGDLLRVISEPYFGYLVGQVREVLEASIPNEKQLKAIESIVLDRMYGWFDNIGDKLTKEEFEEASKKHWNEMMREEPEAAKNQSVSDGMDNKSVN